MQKFIDKRNRHFMEKKTIYNKKEIIKNVRQQVDFMPLYELIIGILSLLGIFFYLAKGLIEMVVYEFNSMRLLIGIIVIVLVLIPFLGIPWAYRFRRGVSDNELLETIIKYGEITSGYIVEKKESKLIFKYSLPGWNDFWTGEFETKHVDSVDLNDEVQVLYLGGKFAVLL